MNPIDPTSSGQFDAGTVTLNADTYVEILRIETRSRREPVIIAGTVAGANLQDLKLCAAATLRGTHQDIIAGNKWDFYSGPNFTPWMRISSTSPQKTAAGSAFLIEIDPGAAAEISLWAKAEGAGTVRCAGTIARFAQTQARAGV
ncbi:MAG: hypothetical protein K8T91_04505 [Planctomycetes bacterium]|nr:hypothetical protein [Planctomycetota bacterium]